ncbi:MAG: polyribonucleotide nucleotidyltransferase [Flavobacteriales bacterium]|nr:polyribonucleotide nucleotidyltransferase [Flavobacteriales bacterium]
MSIQAKSQTIQLADGKTITIETGKLAKQADGSVVVKQGGTMLLATVVSSTELRDGIDFFPLSVDYKEKYTAAGKFPGGYLKREARPSETEILICRLVDRALRPLFPSDYRLDTQVMIQLISYDENASAPEGLAGLAASAALAVSDIPFMGPVSEVQVARVDGEFIVNPNKAEVEAADIDMVIAASMENIMMVEGEMSEVSEEEMIEAIKVAHEAIKLHCQAQIDLAAQVESSKTKRSYVAPASNEEVYAEVKEKTYQKLYDVAIKGSSKQERTASFNAIYDELKSTYSAEQLEELGAFISTGFKKSQKEAVRDCVLNEGVRLDGRATNKIRPIWCEVDYLPSAHGSAVFTRGETQALTSLALGTKLDAQKSDGVSMQREDKFYLHYNFPPFSTGEARPVRGVSRREIGHGNLAWRGLKPVVPTGDDFPYTIRIVSDILESNGSSSMASVCAGTLALMDAGIQISKPVSGIAMGLIYDQETGKYAVLSDILGDEDHLGDMDFKVTGTEDGITATQMDIKIDGLSYEVLVAALFQAKEGRLHILGEMAKTISKPNEEFKPHSPRIIGFTISTEFMGAIIGPGGKVIQELQKETDTVIVLEEKDSKIASVSIAGNNKEGIDKAVATIKGITTVPEAGSVYKGKVKVILDFGAIIEFLPGKEGLLHISEIDHKRIKDVKDELTEGQEVEIKILEIDKRSGKFKLSRKALLPKPERTEAPKA